MSLYICPKCEYRFNTPTVEEYRGETWSACPACGNVDYEAAFQCKGCKADFLGAELFALEYGPNCLSEAMKNPSLVMEYMNLPDVRENFAEFLAEIQWAPKKEET